jgi:P-type Ca2+ transporter type 2C
VNESILTGESFSVTKDILSAQKNKVYSGTLAESGQCVLEVCAIGNHTKFAELGKSVQNIQKEKTLLQQQINSFVKWMALAGTIVFLIIWGINFFQSNNILDSLLKGLTIAMSVLPEEIPVAFATFMAIGAATVNERRDYCKRHIDCGGDWCSHGFVYRQNGNDH